MDILWRIVSVAMICLIGFLCSVLYRNRIKGKYEEKEKEDRERYREMTRRHSSTLSAWYMTAIKAAVDQAGIVCEISQSDNKCRVRADSAESHIQVSIWDGHVLFSNGKDEIYKPYPIEHFEEVLHKFITNGPY